MTETTALLFAVATSFRDLRNSDFNKYILPHRILIKRRKKPRFASFQNHKL